MTTDNIVQMRERKSKAEQKREAEAKAREWAKANLLTRRELAKIPPPVYRIDGIYVEGTLADVYGDSGDGKTFVVLDQVLCIATGKPWHGRATTQGRSSTSAERASTGSTSAWRHGRPSTTTATRSPMRSSWCSEA